MTDIDNIIPNGLRADVMRNKMENKDALQEEGDIYVGTGEKIKITADGNTYEIPKTIGMNLTEAIKAYGGIKKFPAAEVADCLTTITIKSKSDIIKDDGSLTDLAKKSFVYTIGGSQVKLQDANGGKEEVIIPAWSKGMVLSSGEDLLVTYGYEESGSFFYNQAVKTWTSEAVKTTNGGLIPKTSSVNLGSNDNSFNTVYAKRYYLPGTVFNFQYNSNNETQINALMGFNCVNLNGNKVPINAFCFLDGQGEDAKVNDYAWIKAKGIEPYCNNEINFDIQSSGSSDLVFGNRGSTNPISNYIFYNGQGAETYSDIKCKGIYLQTGMEYNSYYNPNGAPLDEATNQNIAENIKSINQRLYDLGFKQAYLVEASSSGTLPEGTRLGTLERWGNVVLIKLDYNFTVLDLGRVLKPNGDTEWKSSWFNPENFNSDGTGTITLFEAQVKDTTGSGTTVLRLKVTRAYSDSYLSLSLDSIPVVAGLSNSITEGSVFAYKVKSLS